MGVGSVQCGDGREVRDVRQGTNRANRPIIVETRPFPQSTQLSGHEITAPIKNLATASTNVTLM